MRFSCPTKVFEVRVDEWGNGNFGASRGKHSDGSQKFHDGLDLVVVPGDAIFSPIDGTVEKVEYPYRSDLKWTGIQIVNGRVRVELWYMSPNKLLVDSYVNVGDTLGIAQNISLKYSETMKPHIHMRVTNLPLAYLINGRWSQYEITLDPQLFLGGI
jgi:hypothetical protein